jgi:fructose-specific phosphotransferase system component IIB
MGNFMPPRPFLPLLMCLLAAVLPNARAEEALTVEQIVQKSVVKDNALRERRQQFICDQTVKTERFGADGKVMKTDTVRTVHRPDKNIAYSTDVKAETANSAEAAAKSQKIEAVMDLGKLASRFQMALAGEEKVRGRACYVVRYWPKSGQSSDTREEKVVNNLKGRFWIAKDDFSILQSDGSLSSPVTVALIASVNRMDFNFHSQSLPNGDTGPADFTVNMAVKAPFYDFREKKVTTQENWRGR